MSNMSTRRILTAAALVLFVAGAARGNFVLTGTQNLTVTTSHATGVLFDFSTADVQQGGHITDA